MVVEYTGRQFVVTQKYKGIADEMLGQIQKLVDRSAAVHVVLSADKYRKRAEVSVTDRSQSLNAACESSDMTTALHDALAKIEQQIVRSRKRATTIMRHPRAPVARIPLEATNARGVFVIQ